MEESLRRHREDRFRQRVDVAAHECGGQQYLYRPGELLVALRDVPLVADELDRWRAERLEVVEELDIARYTVPRDVDVPALVSRLRDAPDGAAPLVGPRHVFTGEPVYHGGPGGFPEPDPAKTPLEPGDESVGRGVTIAVLDTGFTRGVHAWLDSRCSSTPTDDEAFDVEPNDGWRDDHAGHGTFIAGVALLHAPGASITITKVLDSEGYGDEIDISRAIARNAGADILNLSLGAYTHGDTPPVALLAALNRLKPETCVVAAAGNNGRDRVFWPAAMKGVIAVAAVNGRGSRAGFSNYGWWVDACADGVDVRSTFIPFDETAPATATRTPKRFEGRAIWSGTSFATPRVAGSIAAYMTANHVGAGEAAFRLIVLPGGAPDIGTLVR